MDSKKNSSILQLLYSLIIYPICIVLLWNLSFGVQIILTYIIIKNWRWIKIMLETIPRDVNALCKFIRLKYNLWLWEYKKSTIPKLFQEISSKYPTKIAYYYEDEAWTYQEVNQYSNQVGNYFKHQGLKKGDSVALFMENNIEYVCIWLGLSKIGVVTALINTNLRNQPLIHSIRVEKCFGLIYSSELSEAIKEVIPSLKDLKLFKFNKNKESTDNLDCNNVTDFNAAISNSSKNDLTNEIAESLPQDKLLYIFTSGTTGLPKAAVIKHNRYLLMCLGLRILLDFNENDIIYNSLPLYHSSGVAVSAGQSILAGTTVVIRKKFSASNFWKDCIKYNCTAASYIGEICRYLLSVPPNPDDQKHKIKIMFGNGLKPHIWEKFVNRFQIKRIGEFYGATEGNSNLVNLDNKVGTVGFVPRIASSIYPITLIKINTDTEEPVRNDKGFCIKCKPDEPGMLIGKINPKKEMHAFDGYADKSASEKKILRNVFSKGDQYFNSGDILVMDKYGYFCFKDRTGDTFRWKGENVSTSEVEAIISSIIFLKDAIVYGVQVPNNEGRAGMVAILDPDKTLDFGKLSAGIRTELPSYARPLFVRILTNIPLTGTYKLKKKELKMEGYNIELVKDPIYFYDVKTRQFQLLTLNVYENILNGSIKF